MTNEQAASLLKNSIEIEIALECSRQNITPISLPDGEEQVFVLNDGKTPRYVTSEELKEDFSLLNKVEALELTRHRYVRVLVETDCDTKLKYFLELVAISFVREIKKSVEITSSPLVTISDEIITINQNII